MIQARDELEVLRVAVVGAGLAGLACARGLSRQSGCEVTVFEKSRGLGGRCALRSLHAGRRVAIGAPSLLGDAALWRAVENHLGLASGLDLVGDPSPLETLAPELLAPEAAHLQAYGAPDGTLTAFIEALAAGLDVRCQRRAEAFERDADGRWSLVLRLADEGDRTEVVGPFDVLVLALPEPQAFDLLEPVFGAAETSRVSARRRAQAREEAGADALQGWLDAYPVRAGTWQPVFTALLKPPSAGLTAQAVRTASIPGAAPPLALGTRRSATEALATEGFVLHAAPAWSRAHLEEAAPLVLEAMASAWQMREAAWVSPTPGGDPNRGAAADGSQRLPGAAAARPLHRWRYAFTTAPMGLGALWASDQRLGLCGDWLDDGTGGGALRSGLALLSALHTGGRKRDGEDA